MGAYSRGAYQDKIPREKYHGPFSCGQDVGWAKGISVYVGGGDTGQIWVDERAVLHTRFFNSNGVVEQQRIVGVPIGATIEWQSNARIPDGFMLNDGRAFDRYQYQELLKIFPSGQLPDDRGLFKRALDSSDRGSRNYDPGRQLGTIQSDAIRNITGNFGSPTIERGGYGSGAFTSTFSDGGRSAGTGGGSIAFKFDASRVVPTANENRPVNKSVIYITRVF
ncbi:tail fiber protein [Xenorhabdus kozodoii]|uniref:Phage tail protein n=1 Tax=Xenorhabdus kozodoii TaxID=351676 RepID=A0A2D0LDH3_9GAMM|nr:tail fiber protein [Xenorhabdus kozodoii]PHM73721.1 phage tail protein [Xenorhabdus kozodoii]